MSILNRPSDGQHSVLVVICKYLLHRKKASHEEILNECAPLELVNDQKPIRQTLNTWKKLGLFQEEGGMYSFAPDLAPEFKEPVGGLTALPRVARTVALRVENNALFWESEGSLSADFTRAVSWVLAQNIYAMPSDYREVEAAEQRQVRDTSKRIFQNDTRWNGLRAWAPFLGFGWTTKGSSRADLFSPDPTTAVRDSLASVFQGEQELPAAEFLLRLAKILPVLDGGRFRRDVEASLAPESWQAPKAHEVSTSLSRTMLRLHFERSITLPPPRGDADKMDLLGQGRVIRTFSHVTAGEEA